MVETRTIVGATTASALVALVGYAAYFDYRRRHDVEFRKRLLKENRHLARAAEAQATQAAQKDTVRLKAAVNAIINDPAANNLSMQESEQYFLEHVAMGESLANKGPQFEVEAAVAFFKALKVYPAPHELIQIYQRTLPEKVFANIMTCFVLAKAATPGAGRQPSGNAILEEIDTDEAPRSGQSSPKSEPQYVKV